MTRKLAKERRLISETVSLKRDIDELESAIYNLDEEDAELRRDNFKSARNGMIRACVVELQLAIEDMLSEIITARLYLSRMKARRRRVPRSLIKTETFKKILKNIKKTDFRYKLEIAESLVIINNKEFKKLDKLREIRNSCGHNWFLDKKVIVRRGKGRKRRTKPLIEYNGKNLLNKETFLREFLPEYGSVYLRLFLVVMD